LKLAPLQTDNLPVWAKRTAQGVEIHVKVVPGASRTEVSGVLGERLKVRVAAPPELGKANKAVIALLEDSLGVNPLELTAGLTHPEKTLLFRLK
jgi:uncharacterized protein (TIGR00251 family)